MYFTDCTVKTCILRLAPDCISGMYFWNWVIASDSSSDGTSHLNWSSLDTILNLLVSWSLTSLSELEEWEDNEGENELGDLLIRLFLLCFLLLFFSSPSWRTILGRRRSTISFHCLSFLVRSAPFWARMSVEILCFFLSYESHPPHSLDRFVCFVYS